ncbi:type I polyketide synthase [Streptomyces purpurogeneiscleroticus]|uniref:type I polyketide synthase n=1 Tax=Streptomyces purpurogeneiscleroticus TaxID=68259 RepID=UPI001CBC6CCB|nr:type I polyketide synthase [Streptomyces purpurogeneiscleroticus]MBZ4016055.1 hypothetical protein [Streptomyces purpurogeneiscleroticus]
MSVHDEEAIALVGAGCRFPGDAEGMDGLWRLLRDGRDAIGEVPPSRWDLERYFDPDPATPGTMYTRWGGFLSDIDRFDTEFFGIAPREARQMDPQQRLLLEVAWEALEDAGIVPAHLAGTRTAVFTGGLGIDYFLLHARQAGIEAIDPWYATGKEASFTSGRLSYLLGLHGPSLSLNTACSSSLVALHLARQSLLTGESDTALVGGVNLLLSPELTVFMCKAGAMSPEGRCKVFDATANGIVRGDGCAVVVLKRLSDALADGDDVLAVIRGSAVNHDGRSAGLTVPSVGAQERLIRAALHSARVTPQQIGYVEAHGTGTPLGDPIETCALGQVYAEGRPADQPLLIGSVKSNLGHTDAAAGLAGLLKTVLAARHGHIPPTLHLDTPNPNIDWETWRLKAPSTATPWPDRPGRPRLAGISAFGLSGTNAHVIIEAPQSAARPAPEHEPAAGGTSAGRLVLPLSARTGTALRELAAAHRDRLGSLSALDGDPARNLASYVATAASRRTHHAAHRLAVTGENAAELAERLATAATVPGAKVTDPPEGVCLVFSGQGGQWPGMGRGLLQEEAVFRTALDECDALLWEQAGWSVIDELTAPEEHSRLARTEFAQPVIFALQVALAALWRSWGIPVTAVVGHSMGEIAAAQVAGVLSGEEAARIVVHRGQLLQRAAGRGRMATIALGERAVQDLLTPFAGHLWTAAVNGPSSTVVAGDPEALQAFIDTAGAQGHRCKSMRGDHAFHTPQLAPHGQDLVSLLDGLRPRTPRIPFFTTTPNDDGALPREQPVLDAAHWGRNITHPVRFADAVHALLTAGHRAFVEVGPHPVLAQPLSQCLEAAGTEGVLVASMRRSAEETQTVRGALCTLYEAGLTPDWQSVGPSGTSLSRQLPRYPWQGDRLWFPQRAEDHSAGTAGADETGAAAVAGKAATSLPAARPDRQELADLVATLAARVLELPDGSSLTRRQGFAELGMDSLGAVELTKLLERSLQVKLSRVAALDHPTVERLADHLHQQLAQHAEDAQPSAEEADRSATTPAPSLPAPAGPSAGVDGPEPVAVVGLGCRFPGSATGPDAYWQMLHQGVDAIRTVPEERFDSTQLWRGGFLDEVAGFDAAFFRVPPREARVMDPQQRLFLEVAWEALEHAGLPPTSLHGTRTGVFLGMNSTDYTQLVTAHPDNVDAFYGTGNSFTAAAGRLSYLLGMQGPSLAVDTACSSSLVAVHLALRSLRSGESSVALAGGVNLILTDTIHRSTSAMGALAPDGRCKTFDASADGYTRGEGCGVVVLKRLTDALADGDRVHAVLLGSAVNQDGASSGLTAPNGPAQQALVRQALADAHVAPHEVGYVEAHGTGTPLGDPIELQALGAALAPAAQADGQAAPRCWVGSVKTNLGHLEAASGIAGLIKTVLMLGHEEIPAHLHFTRPSPAIAWDELPFDVPVHPVAWPRKEGQRRVAGVSAFGFSGTNAHVVLADPPPVQTSANRRPDMDTGREVLPAIFTMPLSAATRPALQDQARAYRDVLATVDDTDLPALTRTAALRRSHLEQRLVVAGTDRQALTQRLDAFLRGEDGPGISVGRAGETPRRGPVFVFSGHGSYWQGMCQDLVHDEPVFRAAVERCDHALRPHIGWSVTETLLRGSGPETELDQQFLLFSVQYALVETWRHLGIEPAAVVGHSMGEVSAALCAGALSLTQAVEVMVHRTEVLKDLMGRGGMAVVGLDADRTAQELRGLEDRLCVAVVNSYRSTVVSGEKAALAALEARLRQRNIFFRTVAAGAPAHSPLAEPLRERLVALLEGLAPHPPRTPIFSSVTGGRADESLDAAYWGRNLRETVRFADAVRALAAEGHDTFVEISPHPLQLNPLGHEMEAAGVANALLVPSLTRESDAGLSLLTALGDLAVHGRFTHWEKLHPQGGEPVCLPAYPWQHKPYWVEHTAPPATRGGRGGHPLLTRDLRPAGGGASRLVEADIDAALAHDLGAADVHGTRRLPTAAWIEMLLAALAQEHPHRGYRVEQLRLPRPFHIKSGGTAVAQLALDTEPGGAVAFALHARDTGAAEPFREFATGSARPYRCPRAATREAVRSHTEPDEYLAQWVTARTRPGPEAEPTARALSSWRTADALEIETEHKPAGRRWRFAPSVLELALGLPGLLLGEAAGNPATDLYVDRIGSVVIHGTPGNRVRIGARLSGHGSEARGRVWLTDPDGTVLAELDDIRLARAPGTVPTAQERQRVAGRLYETAWREVSPSETTDGASPEDGWLLLADSGGVADALARLLRDHGRTVRVLAPASTGATPPDLPSALQDLLPGPGRRHVIHMTALDLPDHMPTSTDLTAIADATEAVRAAFDAARAASAPDAPVRVLCVTRGAQTTGPGDHPAPLHGPVSSLAAVSGVDFPGVWGGTIDLDPYTTGTEDQAAELLGALLSCGQADNLALREGRRLAARIVRCPAPPPVLEPLALRPDRTYLVAGDDSALTTHITRWLHDRGARTVISLGAPHVCPDAVDRVLKEATEAGVPVAGVIWAGADWHLAAADDAPLTRVDIEALVRERGLGPWVLHDACLRQGTQLDLFVLFGSVASVWGSAGADRHAVPHGLLTALAAHRRALGLPVHDIAWGPWEGVELLDEAGRDLLVRSGLTPLTPDDATELLTHVTAGERGTSLAAAEADWSLLLPLFRQSLPCWPLFDELEESAEVPARDTDALLARLRVAPAHVRDELLLDCVMEEVSVVVGLEDPAELDPQRGFFEMGLSSITVLELRVRLERRFGCRLPATLAFDHPTSDAVARHLATDVLQLTPQSTDTAGPPEEAGTPGTDSEADLLAADSSDEELLALLDKEIAAASDLMRPGSRHARRPADPLGNEQE